MGLSLRPKNCGFDDLTATAGEVIAPRSSGSSRRPRDQRSRAARRVLGILAGLAVGAEVDVSVQQTKHFRLPQDPDPPVIMVGPSTGIAPFRGFMYDRSERGRTGWQFFGERHAASKFANTVTTWTHSGGRACSHALTRRSPDTVPARSTSRTECERVPPTGGAHR